MKKCFVSVALLVFALALFAVCHAETLVRHNVEESDVSISLPDGWYYADRSVDENNPYLKVYYDTAQEMKERLVNAGFFFMAEGSDEHEEQTGIPNVLVHLEIWDQEGQNYADNEDAVLQQMAVRYGELISSDSETVVKNSCCWE